MESFRSESIPEEQPTQSKPKRSPALSFTLEVLQTVVMALILYFLIDQVLGRVRVENISMLPTLQPGEFILVNKLAYRLGDYHRGDIVIFHYPRDPHEDYIKRIMGLPGDVVSVSQGEVKVNGLALDEPYISAPPTYNGEWVVPEGQIFVLGDNRNQSSDSHSWGFVPDANVVGRALVVYWPLDDFQILNTGPIAKAAN